MADLDPRLMLDEEDSLGSYEGGEEEDEEIPWIMWFCGLKGNEFFCEVDEEFIKDDFNLTGLASMVPFYDFAIDMIIDQPTPGEEDLTDEQQHMVESAAETLYGLIHARFITTPKGLALMEEKYQQYHFGRCPRVYCAGQAVLPVGQSDVVRESSVKVFCPTCEDIYYPRSSHHKSLDGAFWGTTFPHLFLLSLRSSGTTVPGALTPQQRAKQYQPRIFGFRVRRKDREEEEQRMKEQLLAEAKLETEKRTASPGNSTTYNGTGLSAGSIVSPADSVGAMRVRSGGDAGGVPSQ